MIRLIEFIVWISLACICIFTALDSSSKIQKAEQSKKLNAAPLIVAAPEEETNVPETEVDLEPGLTIVPPSVVEITEDCTPEDCPTTETYYSRGRLFRWRIR